MRKEGAWGTEDKLASGTRDRLSVDDDGGNWLAAIFNERYLISIKADWIGNKGQRDDGLLSPSPTSV